MLSQPYPDMPYSNNYYYLCFDLQHGILKKLWPLGHNHESANFLPFNDFGEFSSPRPKAIRISGRNVIDEVNQLAVGLRLGQLVDEPGQVVHGIHPVITQPAETKNRFDHFDQNKGNSLGQNVRINKVVNLIRRLAKFLNVNSIYFKISRYSI